MQINTAAANTGMPPTLIPDNNPAAAAMLGSTHHMPYLTAAAAVLQQQQHHPSLAPTSSLSTKQSRAIKIVNPETKKEVDISKLKKTSPSSLARSTLNPRVEEPNDKEGSDEEAIDDNSDSATAADDEVNDEEEDDDEQDEDYQEDDGRSKRYEREFLLSLQFLDQCKRRPANLVNAEYIKKVCYYYNH